MLLAFVQTAGILIGFIPAIRAYKQSLSDGMTIRI
jgi:putative ABC transport system permease protein